MQTSNVICVRTPSAKFDIASKEFYHVKQSDASSIQSNFFTYAEPAQIQTLVSPKTIDMNDLRPQYDSLVELETALMRWFDHLVGQQSAALPIDSSYSPCLAGMVLAVSSRCRWNSESCSAQLSTGIRSSQWGMCWYSQDTFPIENLSEYHVEWKSLWRLDH